MRRITTWLLSTLSALVLLFSYHTSTNSGSVAAVATGEADLTANGTTGSASSGSGATGATGSGSTGSGTTDSGSTATPTPTPSTGSGSSSTSDGTYTGEAIQTRFGPVQVEITVVDGKVAKSVVTQVPWNDHRDQEINGYAVPILGDEAVQAQSADIDMVSGATYTSEGYIQSLQSALDQANL